MEWTKRALAHLKFWEQCRKYGLTLWQCPNFLFIIMGAVTTISMLGSYFIATIYTDPFWVVAIVMAVSTIVLAMGWIIVHSFEKVAAALRMKTEFVSIVSHQLRTPLSSMKWSLEMLLSGRLGEVKSDQVEHMHTLKESNDRMIKLVNDLLNISRVEYGGIVLRKKEFDLEELIRSLIKEFTHYATANNVEIEAKIKDAGLKINADKQYITIVLSNLIDNAIRYIASSGKVIITLTRNGNMARVAVEDDGVGIPEEEQKNIFRKFFRSKNVMRHRTEGTGLGLYLAQAFILLHKGRIGFTSDEDKGSKFWFTLPLIKN